jgi:hypothetical protein
MHTSKTFKVKGREHRPIVRSNGSIVRSKTYIKKLLKLMLIN